MENDPTRLSPESTAFVRLLDLLLSVSKEELEQEMKQVKAAMAKAHVSNESETLGGVTQADLSLEPSACEAKCGANPEQQKPC